MRYPGRAIFNLSTSKLVTFNILTQVTAASVSFLAFVTLYFMYLIRRKVLLVNLCADNGIARDLKFSVADNYVRTCQILLLWEKHYNKHLVCVGEDRNAHRSAVFEVLTSMLLKIQVFWHVAPVLLVNTRSYLRFKGTQCRLVLKR
jgi:hypothetical protein